MRKRFKFSLERVLAIRRLEERIRKAVLVAAQSELFAAEETKRKSEIELADGTAELAALRQHTPLPVIDCLRTEALLEDFKKIIVRKAKTVEQRKADVERAKQDYFAASTRRKAIDRLREARKIQHQKEMASEEAKQFDAIASERAHHKSLDQNIEEEA